MQSDLSALLLNYGQKRIYQEVGSGSSDYRSGSPRDSHADKSGADRTGGARIRTATDSAAQRSGPKSAAGKRKPPPRRQHVPVPSGDREAATEARPAGGDRTDRPQAHPYVYQLRRMQEGWRDGLRVHRRPLRRHHREDERGRCTHRRHSRLLRTAQRRHPLTDAATVLLLRPPRTEQARSRRGRLSPRRGYGHPPDHEHDVRDDEHARGHLTVLEHRLRSRKGRGDTRHRGHADHADPRHEHGLAAGEDPCRRLYRSPAKREACVHELHQISRFQGWEHMKTSHAKDMPNL